MTISELEYAVTSPFRFTAALRHSQNTTKAHNELIPYFTRILHNRTPRHSDLDLENSTIYLVPGGRFLLTGSRTGIMLLWDLGYNPRASIEPFPVASIVFEHVVGEFEVQATSDGLGIRICIVIRPTPTPPSTLIKILEIYPMSLPASFLQIAEFSLPHHIVSYSFNKDLFAYSCQGHVGVHNFVSNTAVAWTEHSEFCNDVSEG